MSKHYSITNRNSSIYSLLGFGIGLVIVIVNIDLMRDREGIKIALPLALFGLVCFAIGLFFAIRDFIIRRIIKRRKLRMAEISLGSATTPSFGIFSDSALNNLDDTKLVRNRAFDNFVEENGLVYADFSYDINGKTKYGEYRAETHYYSVMAAKLPRKMPHVVFDSLKSRKRQFRFVFAGNQLHNLEGDFNNHFAVYFPFDYHIDSLSFLAPDVLWALKEASEYDFEIVNDKVYMFGPMEDPDVQIKHMAKKLQAVVAALGKSPETYRDERLPYEQSRQQVTALGAVLSRNLIPEYIKLGLGIVGVIGAVVMAKMIGVFHSAPFYLLLFSVVFAGKSIRRISKEKQRRKAALQQSNLHKH